MTINKELIYKFIEPREPTYENGKMDGRAEVLEAATHAHYETVQKYEEKIKLLEKKLKKLKEEFDMSYDDLEYWDQRDYTEMLKRIKKIFKEK